MLILAEHILDSKAEDFDPSQFHDRYEVAMLKTKQAGLPAPTSASAPAGCGNVVDLRRRSNAALPARLSLPP